MLYIYPYFLIVKIYLTPWRNGSASDSRSEGWVFKALQGQIFSLSLFKFAYNMYSYLQEINCKA